MNDSDRELLELIDSGSHAYAHQLVSRKLKQYPNRSFYHAARNQLLYATGKTDEAIAENSSLAKKCPNDPATLKLLSKFFKNIGMVQQAELVYDNALKKYPSSGLAYEWFKESLKAYDVKSIQKSLMVLQKTDKNNRKNAFMAGFSCYLFANSTESEKEATLFRSLAIKLIEGQKPFTNEQQLFSLVKALEASGDYRRVNEEVEEYMKQNVIALDIKIIYLSCLDKTESWDKLFSFSKKQIFEDDFNDFDTWKLFIKSAKKVAISFEEIREAVLTYKISRNTKLALIELNIAYGKSILAPVLEYFDSYGSKPCFYTDITHYISRGEIRFATLRDNIEDPHFEPPSVSNLIRHINLQKLSLKAGCDHKVFIQDNTKIYSKFASLLQSKQEFDPFPGNELLVMNSASDLSQDNGITMMFHHFLILSKAMSTDENNFTLMLWSLFYNSYFGFSDLALNAYKRLKIKMIQHDTLSHYLTLMPSKNNLNEMVNVYRFYMTADEELDGSLLDGFENSVFSRLESFVNFGKKITYSITRYLLILNIIRSCKILKNTQYLNYFNDTIKSVEPALVGEYLNLYDNRDFKTLWNFGTLEEQNLFNEVKRKSEYVLLNLVRNLLIYPSDNQKRTARLLKLFNKYMSNPNILGEQLSKVEIWINKIYLNVFKVIKTPDAKDLEASKNYLSKNLKFSKIRDLLIENPVSAAFNNDVAALIELTKDLNILAKINKSITILNLQLAKDLKEFDIKDTQLKKLAEIKRTLSFDKELINKNFVDVEYIDKSFEVFRDCVIHQSRVLDYV